jgi:SRSO17 transposase
MLPLLDTINFAQWDQEFVTLYHYLAPAFARAEPRMRVRDYLLGLLHHLERKNSWTLAEQMGERDPHGVQRLLNQTQWDVGWVRDILCSYVVEHLGDPAGILVLDETGFLKKGNHSAGVARQYSGTAGRIENCQVGVFLAYSTPRGYAFIDRSLYLPQEWTADPARYQQAHIPLDTPFATKPELGQQMLQRACAAGVPARWVVADSFYETPDLCAWCEQHDLWYVLGVPATQPIWTADRQVPAAALIADLPRAEWTCLSAGVGSQGARLYDWAWWELAVASAPGRRHWLLARRSLTDPTEYAYYHVYAASTTSLPEMVRVVGTRWVIESGFAQAKGEVGLDQYQVRSWTGWYRAITLALVAYAYLAVLRAAAPLPSPEQVALSVPEIRHLLAGRLRREPEVGAQAWWSGWRRRHQATARRCHEQRRARRPDQPAQRLPPARQLAGLGPLTEERWVQIAALLPGRKSAEGRPPREARGVLEAMLWVMGHGSTWRQLPPERGARFAVQRRYGQWVKAGIWEQIVAILQGEAQCPAVA